MSGAEVPDVPEPVPLSNVAHELLSPLAAMRGYLELIVKDGLDHLGDRQRAHLETALINADRLQNFIEDLIELARIERGQAEYSPTLVSPSDILELRIRGLRKAVADADLGIRVDAGGVPPVSMDVRGVGRVVDRILNHAMQYVPKSGSLEIAVRSEGSRVTWSFFERGVVFEKEEFAQFFEPFAQPYFADAGRRLKQGTLALATAKKIVEFQGGKMSAEPGKDGLVIRFSLPKDGRPGAK